MKFGMVVAIAALSFVTGGSVQGAESTELDVGSFISQVTQGEDFSGTEIVLSGIALTNVSGGDKLVNIGTQATYNSGAYENFVSVYDVTSNVRKGSQITVRVKVDSAEGYELGGKNIVLIETNFLSCVSC